jgi:hypothetical protein
VLELITREYENSQGQSNLSELVDQTVRTPAAIQSEVLEFLQKERDINDQFDWLVAHLGEPSGVTFNRPDGVPEWQVSLYPEIPLSQPTQLPPLRIYPFREYKVQRETSYDIFLSETGEMVTEKTPIRSRLMPYVIGFYITSLYPDKIYNSELIHPRMRGNIIKNIGCAWRKDPDTQALSGINITPAVLENQNRFEILLGDVFKLIEGDTNPID